MFKPKQNQSFSPEQLPQIAAQETRNSLQSSIDLLRTDAELIMEAVSQFDVDPRDLTSDKVQQARQLPRKFRKNLTKIQEEVKSIIWETASSIEAHNYQQWQEKINEKFPTRREQERAAKLLSVDKQISISYRSLAIAVEHFTELNKVLLNWLEVAEKNKDSTAAKQLVIANAVLVYELCDFVIHFIKDFTIDGINDLNILLAESRSYVAEFRREQGFLRQQAMKNNISDESRQNTLGHISSYENELDRIEQEWDSYLGEIEDMKKSHQGIYAKLDELELMRSNAGAQLHFISILQLHAFISTNLHSLNLAADIITTKLQMPRMTPERVQILLGKLEKL